MDVTLAAVCSVTPFTVKAQTVEERSKKPDPCTDTTDPPDTEAYEGDTLASVGRETYTISEDQMGSE